LPIKPLLSTLNLFLLLSSSLSKKYSLVVFLIFYISSNVLQIFIRYHHYFFVSALSPRFGLTSHAHFQKQWNSTFALAELFHFFLDTPLTFLTYINNSSISHLLHIDAQLPIITNYSFKEISRFTIFLVNFCLTINYPNTNKIYNKF
jgi:hypothetical protein